LAVVAAIELRGIRKSFDGFLALDGAEFTAERGEVHALLGENGAGKSSLMNIAAGLYAPDAGEIKIDGTVAWLSGPREAMLRRIGMVHQHYKLVNRFTVAENVLLANPERNLRTGISDIAVRIRRHAEALGFTIDPQRAVGSLSIAEQQRVEIIKVLVAGAEILILDEPTAVLTDLEAERVLTIAREIARRGAAVILVTHKLAEVKTYADKVTVMRAGRTIACVDPKRTSAAELTTLTIGTAVTVPRRSAQPVGGVRLRVDALDCARPDGHMTVSGMSFVLRSGEIYAIAGVGGNGQTELAEALMGVRIACGGAIRLDDVRDVTALSPAERRDLGFAAIPADRQGFALATALSVVENFAIGQIHSGRFGSWARVRRARMRAEAAHAINDFEVQGVLSLSQKAGLLSGGNAQKLVLAREFNRSPKIIVAHSPTRGLDLRACTAIHARLVAARDGGAAVLLISENLDEVLSLSDRVGVMTRGRIVAEFVTPADRQAVGCAMVDHA
jgi:general nucleoside transport system ATP-binding protein